MDANDEPIMIHPNIQIVKTAKHEENVLRYMGKEDPECKDLAPDDPNIVEMIWAAQTKTDALRCAKGSVTCKESCSSTRTNHKTTQNHLLFLSFGSGTQRNSL